ncbi:hypothetical protein cypCar_00044681, partial [Cyprinus carpio]
LKKKLTNDTVDLSGIPLSSRDLHRVAYYLQNNGSSVTAVDISFTELQDECLRLLLPFLGVLPKLTTLAINGNRLTVAILKDLIEVVKDPKKFPSLAWVDLGNNVDIFTVPQPLLVALRRRFGMRSSLPTIYEYSEGQGSNYFLETSTEEISVFEEEEEDEEDRQTDECGCKPLNFLSLWSLSHAGASSMWASCCGLLNEVMGTGAVRTQQPGFGAGAGPFRFAPSAGYSTYPPSSTTSGSAGLACKACGLAFSVFRRK